MKNLDFNGKPVRAFMVEGVPWLALPDVLAACGYNERGAEHVHKPGFPAFGKMVESASSMTLLSPTGVFYWAEEFDPRKTDKFTAWARREARRICTAPRPGDPSFYLQVVKDPDGWNHVPPGPPSRYSGWKAEWDDLKDRDPEALRKANAENVEWNRRARAAREAEGAPKGITLKEVLAPARAILKASPGAALARLRQ
jgi:hypothetical protein